MNHPVIFLYTLVVLAVSLAAGITATHLITKKRKIFMAFLLIFSAIAIDLFLFNLFLYEDVTDKRRNIKFNEFATGYKFPAERKFNLVSDYPFENYRPALYKEPVALTSYSIEDDFSKRDKIDTVYGILNDGIRKDDFNQALNTLNIKQFIKYGFNNISKWPLGERVLFLNVLQATLAGFDVKKDFYAEYIDIDKITAKLAKILSEDGSLFLLSEIDNSARKEFEQEISILFEMTAEPLYVYEGRNYYDGGTKITAKNINNKKLPREETRKFYNFLYNDLTAKQYLDFLFENEHNPGQIFVLLKDYYDFITSQTQFKGFVRYGVFLDDNLRRKMGVGAPTIKYYSSARFLSRDKILEKFKEINKPEEDILFLEPNGTQCVSENPGKVTNNFSYKVLGYNPNKLSLVYSVSENGYLYYSDCYDTYWNAYVDGEKTKIFKANVAFKAIKIPAGRHRVDFIYNPKFFRISLWFYYITFGICAIYLILGAVKKLDSK